MMPFSWRAFLLAVALWNDHHIIVMTLHVTDTNWTGVAGGWKRLALSYKEGRNEETAVKEKRSAMTSPADNVNDAAEVHVKGSEWKMKHEELLMRRKRSLRINLNDNVTATGTADDEGDDPDVLRRMRFAKARLIEDLRSRLVSREKVVPLAFTDDGDTKVLLHLGIRVLSVVDVNDVHQLIETGLYMNLVWHDEALAWNKSFYEHVETVHLSPEFVWTPSIIIPNSANIKDVLGDIKVLVVTHEGYVSAYTPLLLETSCPMDLTLYPFDEQTCTIKLGADSSLIEWRVQEEAFDDKLTSALALSSSELTNVSTRMYVLDEKSLLPEVVLVVRRKTTFYEVCLIQPMVVTFYLNTLVFLIPLQNGEKISFLVSLCVSTSVFTSFFSSTMPRGLDKLPIIMVLLMGLLVETILVLLATLLILNRFSHELEASAVTIGSHGKDSRITGIEHDPEIPAKPDVSRTDHTTTSTTTTTTTTTRAPQPLPEELKPGSDGTSRLLSLSRVATMDTERRASRAERYLGLQNLTSCQLDRIMFVVFMMGNTIFHIVLLSDVM